MSEPKKLPTARLGRAARLALLGARTGAGLMFEKRGELAAAYAADVLGNMRGLAAKVGQIASYVDGVVPERKREAFEKALSALRDAAWSSPPEAVRRLVEEELGGSMDELFAEWEERPFASASIGQVHRARLHDGLEVAVKVQHAGIEEAVEHDLANASLMSSLQGAVLGARFETKRVMDEVKRTLREELDYRLEAKRQTAFAALHRADRDIRIPRVIDERCSRRVFTTVFASGARLEEASAKSEAERRRWAQTLWRFVFRSVLVAGQFNADPHPGNFFFHDDGAITAMDFGCVVAVPDARRRLGRALHAAAIERNLRAFHDAGRAMMGTKGGVPEEVTLEYLRRLFEPLFDSPYRITRPYAASLLEEGVRGATKALRAPKAQFIPMPEGMIFMNRLQFGFYSVLARLDVEVDYAAIERELLAEPLVSMTV